MAAQAVYAWPQRGPAGRLPPAITHRAWEGPGKTHVSLVPPVHQGAHEPLVPPLGSPVRDVIALDAMGGDYAPDEIVAGALAAQREHGVTTLLTGPPARLRPVIARLG